MIFSTTYTKEQLVAEIKKVILARANGEEISIDDVEIVLSDALAWLQDNR